MNQSDYSPLVLSARDIDMLFSPALGRRTGKLYHNSHLTLNLIGELRG
jgi:hypothetical protein